MPYLRGDVQLDFRLRELLLSGGGRRSTLQGASRRCTTRRTTRRLRRSRCRRQALSPQQPDPQQPRAAEGAARRRTGSRRLLGRRRQPRAQAGSLRQVDHQVTRVQQRALDQRLRAYDNARQRTAK